MALPSDVSGLRHWFRADDLSRLADGAAVTSWPDRVSGGASADQATAARQPTIRRGALGGQDAVRFDGGDTLALAQRTWGPEWTFFVVHRVITQVNGAGPLGNDFTNTTSQRVFQMPYMSTTSIELLVFRSVGTRTAAVAASQTGPVVSCGENYTDGLQAFFNGSAGTKNTNAGSPLSPTTGQLTIGSTRGPAASSSGYFVGDVADVIAYDKALTAAERATVHSYVQDRYGIPVADYQPPADTGGAGSSQTDARGGGRVDVLSGGRGSSETDARGGGRVTALVGGSGGAETGARGGGIVVVLGGGRGDVITHGQGGAGPLTTGSGGTGQASTTASGGGLLKVLSGGQTDVITDSTGGGRVDVLSGGTGGSSSEARGGGRVDVLSGGTGGAQTDAIGDGTIPDTRPRRDLTLDAALVGDRFRTHVDESTRWTAYLLEDE